jgi:hypothetical protein
MGDEWLVVVALWLCSYRLTRLLVRDTFPPIAVQRARIAERWGDASWQAYLSTCSWCAGVWVAGVVTLAAWGLDQFYAYTVPVPVLVWGAGAALTGLLASWEQEEPDE